MATDTFTGPVDYVVFSFPPGARADVGLQLLLDRIDAGVIEILDLECVGRADDGSGTRLALAELQVEGGFDLSVFDGAESRILDGEDLDAIAAALQPGWVAVAIVYEERSLADVAGAWTAAGGELLLSGGVDLDDLEEALTDTNEGESR